MIMPDFKENSAIDSWLANINLTSAESQLAQQLAATDASTAAYLNQLALTASGASGLKSDPISSLGSFSWWTSSDNLGHNSNTASTPMDGLSDSFVSSMLANAGLLNNDTAAGSKNELKEEGSMLDQDLAATGLASANWLLGTGIDPPSAAAAVAVAAAAASTGTTNHPFSLIATTPLISPETSSTEAAKEKVNIGITTENAELNEFRRQLREYREHISLEVPTLSL
ncbi:hypothetical protein BDF19DRAFT_456952 [Syncephalis fuscata]|nr:hypothetical protein BDF19DRAFT_456952 [Syncephalis fuscata]